MRTRRLFALTILIALMACDFHPALWGTFPPPPTMGLPTNSPTVAPPTLAPTDTPTPKPTPLPSILWIGPSVPKSLREIALTWGYERPREPRIADIHLDATLPTPGALHVSTWIFALVAPFPTVTDGISFDELLSLWKGTSTGAFKGRPIFVNESTLLTFTALWGEPDPDIVKMLADDADPNMVDTAWAQTPSLAIIPFESIESKWKVLMVDGQSPIHKKFNPDTYPLKGYYRVTCDNSCPTEGWPSYQLTNRDPSKLTTVILTGVTAMARATAVTMNARGVLFPGKDIRDLLREADILHINNEVPFYTGCPDPDPLQVKIVFCSQPRYMDLLTDIGMDVVELSGDHFNDYGDQAMWETLAIYEENNIPYYGGGKDIEDGKKPLLMEVNGNKLMFIGCNIKDIYALASDIKPGAVLCDFPYMTEQIELYRAQGYLPIATFQYHEFASPEARPQQKIDYRTLAEAGAVIVSGSQAHVPQVMEFYDSAFIHYGLGNLFFDQMGPNGDGKRTRREFIVRHVFYDGKYLGAELFTTFLEDYARPRFMTDVERAQFLANYFQESGWIPAP